MVFFLQTEKLSSMEEINIPWLSQRQFLRHVSTPGFLEKYGIYENNYEDYCERMARKIHESDEPFSRVEFEILKNRRLKHIYSLPSVEPYKTYQEYLSDFRAKKVKSLAATLLDSETLKVLFEEVGETPLHKAAREGVYETIEILLEISGSTLLKQEFVRNVDGHTPLHLAAKEGYNNIVELFLSRKNVKNSFLNPKMLKDNDGRTALHWSARGGYSDVTALLLKGSSLFLESPYWEDDDGVTPLDLARNSEDSQTTMLIRKALSLKKR